MKKIAINSCFGGFFLSPECAILAYENGMRELGVSAYEYFRDSQKQMEAYTKWLAYKKGSVMNFLLDVFVDMGTILNTSPSNRDHPALIYAIETLGEEANGPVAKIEIVEVPEDMDYYITDYDGIEDVHYRRPIVCGYCGNVLHVVGKCRVCGGMTTQ